MELPGCKHVDESAHASAALFNEMIPGVDRELPNRWRVLAQAGRRQKFELSLSQAHRI
jgi:hypothetical protein